MFPEARDCLTELDDDLFPFPTSDSEHEYSEFVSPPKLHHFKRRGRSHVDNVSFSSLIIFQNQKFLIILKTFAFQILFRHISKMSPSTNTSW